MYDNTCDRPVPAALAATLPDSDARNPCYFDAGHLGPCQNGHAQWTAEPAGVPRYPLLAALLTDVRPAFRDLFADCLRVAELARPSATDRDLVADAKASIVEFMGVAV
jgi:hypothetical protein